MKTLNLQEDKTNLNVTSKKWWIKNCGVMLLPVLWQVGKSNIMGDNAEKRISYSVHKDH